MADTLSTSKHFAKRRLYFDIGSRYLIGLGGISVIIAIVLIFFFLLYVVHPLFNGAQMQQVSQYRLPLFEAGQSLHLAVEEQTELAVRYTDRANAVFFETKSGKIVKHEKIIHSDASISSFAASNPIKNLIAFGLSNGRVIIAQHEFNIRFDGGLRSIEANLLYPLEEKNFSVFSTNNAIKHLAIEKNDNSILIAAVGADNKIKLVQLNKEESLLEESLLEESQAWESETVDLPSIINIGKILINHDLNRLYIVDNSGELSIFDISNFNKPTLLQRLHILPENSELSNIELLSGGISLLVASKDGEISQWFSVKDNLGNDNFKKIRSFPVNRGYSTNLVTEVYRKGFISTNNRGAASLYHATSKRLLLTKTISPTPLTHIALAPRANAMLAQDKNNRLFFWRITNEHPEVSWRTLWGKVWYENYSQPDYVWQSSAASNDFEPKLSLVPISFGTIKAAFYAMMFALPLSIFGAIYTAYFMTPKMRHMVKPSIEIMEALPTVILGFLAGLWLAPFVEEYLVGIFLLLLLLPPGMMGSAYVYRFFPNSIRSRIPDGWEAAILLLPMVFIIMFCLSLSPYFELWFFGGDFRSLLSNKLGFNYDQRNSIIVGIAMGFAVIPTIFTIAEDAIFGVPKHLTNGSLALGATPWQTLTGVVLLTASPGIFSAAMIGMGRAVGETMIVLMATGNTPLMDFSIFQGMRTLSANIAVEMPEAEVDSTHFRILFLAGLVLFIFTFAVNTIAELVRQHLREKYSNL